MKSATNPWLVPVSSFALAVLLAFVAGPLRPAHGRRAADSTGGTCKTDITDVKAEAHAKKWDPTAPGQGSLEVSGSFDTKFNTQSWSGADFVSLRVTLTVHDTLENKDFSGEAFGTAGNSPHTAKKTSSSDDDVQSEGFPLGKDGKVTISDGDGLNGAILDAARKLAFAGQLGQGDTSATSGSVDTLKKSLKTKADVFLAIHMGGLLHDGATPCPKRWHGEVVIAIDDKGNSKKDNLTKVDGEPGRDEPFPQ